eukprot:scaffold119080_cov26-Cyclotella_meneghiniana.AAC.1
MTIEGVTTDNCRAPEAARKEDTSIRTHTLTPKVAVLEPMTREWQSSKYQSIGWLSTRNNTSRR